MALTSTKYLGIALIVASLLPLSHGSKLLSSQYIFIEESTSRQAVVVGMAGDDLALGEKKTNHSYSVVEFTDDEGTSRTARTNVGSYPPQHSIGAGVGIRFHRSKKNDVRIDSFTGLWLESAFYLIPGIATLLGGFGLMLSARKPHS